MLLYLLYKPVFRLPSAIEGDEIRFSGCMAVHGLVLSSTSCVTCAFGA